MKSLLIKILGALLAETSLANISRKQLIIMSGSPRSGTTFVAQNLAKALYGCPLVWEPLQDENLSRIKQKDFCIRPIWKDVEENVAIQSHLNKILSKGRI